MKTHIYACYLPGSTTPDYIGSHNVNTTAQDRRDVWKYTNRRYLGQGIWMNKDTGNLVCSSENKKETRWGALLASLNPDELLTIRTEVLTEVEQSDRWRVEGEMLRLHKPPYNVIIPLDPDVKRLQENAYQRKWRKQRNTPEVLATRNEYMRRYRATHSTPETRARRAEYQRTSRKKPITAEKRAEHNEHCRAYTKEYFLRNPDKRAAKNEAQRLRMRIIRAERKAAKIASGS